MFALYACKKYWFSSSETKNKSTKFAKLACILMNTTSFTSFKLIVRVREETSSFSIRSIRIRNWQGYFISCSQTCKKMQTKEIDISNDYFPIATLVLRNESTKHDIICVLRKRDLNIPELFGHYLTFAILLNSLSPNLFE